MTTGYFLTSHPTAVPHTRPTTQALLCPAATLLASPTAAPARPGARGQQSQAMVGEMFSREAQLRGAPLLPGSQGQPRCWDSPSPRPRCCLLSNERSQSRNSHFPASWTSYPTAGPGLQEAAMLLPIAVLFPADNHVKPI